MGAISQGRIRTVPSRRKGISVSDLAIRAFSAEMDAGSAHKMRPNQRIETVIRFYLFGSWSRQPGRLGGSTHHRRDGAGDIDAAAPAPRYASRKPASCRSD